MNIDVIVNKYISGEYPIPDYDISDQSMIQCISQFLNNCEFNFKREEPGNDLFSYKFILHNSQCEYHVYIRLSYKCFTILQYDVINSHLKSYKISQKISNDCLPVLDFLNSKNLSYLDSNDLFSRELGEVPIISGLMSNSLFSVLFEDF